MLGYIKEVGINLSLVINKGYINKCYDRLRVFFWIWPNN